MYVIKILANLKCSVELLSGYSENKACVLVRTDLWKSIEIQGQNSIVFSFTRKQKIDINLRVFYMRYHKTEVNMQQNILIVNGKINENVFFASHKSVF